MKSRACLLTTLVALTGFAFSSATRGENEIGFIEKFALASDREKVLGELVPGSEDYYFFHALHYQNTRNDAKLADILAQWRKRFPDEAPKRRIIENRDAILGYDASPQKTLDYLKERLGVRFDHQQEARDRKPDLPVALDQRLIAREVFERNALANNGDLGAFSEEALERLVANRAPLTPQQRRALLGRLRRPDVANLVEFIAADLNTRESRGFGEFAIHRALLPEQLDALAKAVPALATNEAFVFTRLRKLAPGADVDFETDAAAREAWLDRLWAYANTLPPAFNTVKAHILFRRLDHDRKKGVYDQQRLIEYLKLPRQTGYTNPKWLEKTLEKQNACDLNADLAEPLLRNRPIGSDEELVRDCFLNIFRNDANLRDSAVPKFEDHIKYTEYVRDTWLKPVFAEAVITFGFGKPEQWASLIGPQEFQRLKERVDIEFPRTNAEQFAPGENVAFDVTVKNTPKLMVRIYELNALNFFLTQKRQLNTDLNLDGLVANSEETHTSDAGPFRRTRQTFKFPRLAGKRGAWIIEFIGGGRSSRVLVRKGQWQLAQRTGPGGDLLTVLDERGEQVKDAVAWLDGRAFRLDEKLGSIVVPFTQQPGRRHVVLASADGSFATLANFEHHAEEYRLDAQFHIEREQLLARRQATLAIRTALLLGESQLDPRLLSEPRLAITSVSLDGIRTTREIKDLKLSAGSVLTNAFEVPERTARLEATLTAQVGVLSAGGEKRTLSASHSWDINGIAKTHATSDGHLAKFGSDHVYELLGRNGEPVADQQIVFTFTHREFSRTETIALQTDAKGRVALGALAGISGFTAKATNGREGRFAIEDFHCTRPGTIHAKAGDILRIPLPPELAEMQLRRAVKDWVRAYVSLLEVRAGTFVADHGGLLSVSGGFLVIEGLPAGDHALRLHTEGRDMAIKVTAGAPSHGWYLGGARNLEAVRPASLHVVAVMSDDDTITVRLANATPLTRVHVAASRFAPGRTLFSALGGFTRFGSGEGTPAHLPNLYAAGREIGDEYRYILERRYAKLFPGNMLTRPGLLLNPWDVRDTGLRDLAQETGEAAGVTAGEKEAVSRRGGAEKDAPHPGRPKSGVAEAGGNDLDFLAAAAPVLYNLMPDAGGAVKISRKALGDRQHIQIHAEDLHDAVWRSFALPETETKLADTRLMRNLDPARSFAEKKEVTVIESGRTLVFEDIRTSELEAYDTLGGVHSLFTTLSHDANLTKFAWVLQWPNLNDDEKRAKYSEFACHELSFFLSRKDPAFFEKVIKPYLANKKDRTFMDDFLLGNDLKPYLGQWAFGRLNAVERALLAQRLPGDAAAIARGLREQWEMQPPAMEKFDVYFDTGLRGRAMDADDTISVGRELRDEKANLEPAAAAAKPRSKTETLAFSEAVATGGKVGANRKLAELKKDAAAGLSLNVESVEMLADELPKLKAADPALGDHIELLERRSKVLNESLGTVRRDADADGAMDGYGFFGRDVAMEARAAVRAYFRPVGATKEWAENNYFRLPIGEQNAALVPVNAFWRDFAAHIAAGAKGPFLSPHVTEASRNFTEMMLALAVLDLPFDAPKHTTKTDGAQFTFTAGGPAIIFHKEIKPAADAQPGQVQLLVSQSFFRQADRYRMEGNEKLEKYVTGEFLTGAVYGANVVLTNPASTPLKTEVLMQIPQGAIPVAGSKATASHNLRLDPYTTKTFEYFFYFPAVPAKAGGKFPQFPVNIAVGGASAGAAKAFEFNVVARLTQVDKASWDYVSQYGTPDEVFAFLDQNNLASLDLARIAWRSRDADFFRRIIAFLDAHHVWNETLYRYALLHNDAAPLREWLKHNDSFLNACGPWLSSRLILLDPTERRAYEHLEYSPLVNQRAHRLGSEWRIANPAVLAQYSGLLEVLAHKPQLDAADSMSVTYYLFLQDRVDEALARFRSIDASALPTRIQHDYFRCYAGFFEGNLADARGIASRYADFPVARWRRLFAEVTTQLDEIEGRAVKPERVAQPDREKQQGELAATEPVFDFKVENRTVALTWKNLGEVTVNYYLMDPEFSFSSNPFVSQDAGRASIIKPGRSDRHELPKDRDALDVPLPAEFARANVLVEVAGAGRRKTQAYHANTLTLTVAENYGRLDARDSGSGRPVSKAYVKVYARLKNGTVRFFKDGYTDLRGRFDYASLNGSPGMRPPASREPEPAPANGLDYQMLKPAELKDVEKLALLILSDTNGATTRELNPPRD